MICQYETILVNNHDRWVRLILNRPDVKNALSEKMTTELLSVLENIKEDKNIRGVSIEGSGDAFCAGADLKDFRRNFVLQTPDFDQVRTMNLEAGKLFKILSQLPKIVVALVLVKMLFFGHNSGPSSSICMRICGNCSYRPPGPL